MYALSNSNLFFLRTSEIFGREKRQWHRWIPFERIVATLAKI